MPLSAAQRRHAATHHGVFTRDVLRSLGSTDANIAYLIRAGVLLRARRGVLVMDGVPPTWEQSVAVACASHPLVAASHRSCGRLLTVRRLGPHDDVEVTVPGRVSGRLTGLVVHHSHRLPAEHVVVRPDGIRHTTPARMVFDLASVLSDGALESVIEQVLDRGWTTIPDLVAIGDLLCERGRNGSERFGRVLAARPAWRRPAESDLEVRLDRALRALGLPPAARRRAIALADGTTIHPDLWWPELRLAVEIDHVTWHGGRLDSQYDKRRDRQLARLGIQVVRVTDEDVAHRLAAAADDVAAIVRLRQRAA